MPLVLVIILYALGKRAAPRPRKSRERDAPYACGEDFPPVRPHMVVNFFWYIAIFLIFDVVDFIVALSYGVDPLWPLAYTCIAMLALLVALTYRTREGSS